MQMSDQSIIASVAGFALAAHAGQQRKYTGEDYYNHPKRVSEILFDHGYTDIDVLAAAILHDTVEDTHITQEQIVQYFGEDIAEMVDWLTKRMWRYEDGVLMNRADRKRAEVVRLAKAPAIVKTIKLADRLDNLPSVIEYDAKFAPIIVAETRTLLDNALKEGDSVLWAKLDAIVRDYQQQNA